MEKPQPIAFEIARIGGEEESERVRANSFESSGNPLKYTFRQDGAVVREIFAHALENEPKAIYPQTAEEQAAWKQFAARANEANQSTYLPDN